MNLQYIKDSQGKPTGVFIPIEEWEALEKKFHFEEYLKSFELSAQQKTLLDERLKSDKNDFISARDALKKIREKHEL